MLSISQTPCAGVCTRSPRLYRGTAVANRVDFIELSCCVAMLSSEHFLCQFEGWHAITSRTSSTPISSRNRRMTREAAISRATRHFDEGEFISDLARRVAIRTESQVPESRAQLDI